MHLENRYRLEPHVCRSCFSRIASRPTDDDEGHRIYQCTNCGLEAEGARASVLCACGTKVRRGKGSALSDAGIRCHANADPSPEFPSLYTASFGVAELKT